MTGSDTNIARVAALTPEGPKYWSLELEVSACVCSSLARPGQYTTLGVGALAPRFVVIASTPEEAQNTGRWDFLIDRGTNLGLALAGASSGDAVAVGSARGCGFELPDAGPVFGFVTGSGLATLRPVWCSLRQLDRLHLYYGEARAEDFAWGTQLDRLMEAGARVERVWSERTSGPRFVQEAFLEAAPAVQRGRALLSGSEAMRRAVRAVLLDRGVPERHILTNV